MLRRSASRGRQGGRRGPQTVLAGSPRTNSFQLSAPRSARVSSTARTRRCAGRLGPWMLRERGEGFWPRRCASSSRTGSTCAATSRAARRWCVCPCVYLPRSAVVSCASMPCSRVCVANSAANHRCMRSSPIRRSISPHTTRWKAPSGASHSCPSVRGLAFTPARNCDRHAPNIAAWKSR